MTPPPRRPNAGRPQPARPADARVVARFNEAAAHYRQGRPDRAYDAVRKILEKHPAHPEANRLAALALVAMNQPERARYHAERAVKADPANGRNHLALGMILMAAGDNDAGAAAYEQALELLPDDPEALAGLGSARAAQGRVDEAEELLNRALSVRPGWPEGQVALANVYTNTARPHEAVRLLRAVLDAHPAMLPVADQLALASSYDGQLSPEEAFACHRAFGRIAESTARPVGPHANTPEPNRRIRLAYLSAELRNHSNSFFLRPLLEHRDRERFEVVMYHTSRSEDAVTAELKRLSDRWVACEGDAPIDLARRIHADRVDVLVELTGHFARNRLLTVAARPAPVQVTYLGYGNTTGLATLDARIVDHHTDPAPGFDALASEPLVRLDRCFLTFRPDDDAPEPGEPEPGRPFTFGSFNDVKKLTPGIIALWARLLERCPDARLLLKTAALGHEPVRRIIAERFAAAGVAPDRVRLAGRIDSDRGHLALYDEMDAALDTFPYAGTTTTCQALWQGVPVVTLAGRTHAGRVGVSLLHATGAPEWIAPDEDAYLDLAAGLCAKGPRPRAERLALRERVRGSELLDHADHALAVEAVYDRLWRDWCARGAR